MNKAAYGILRVRQALGLKGFIVAVLLLLVAAMGGFAFVYTYAPYFGEQARRNRNIENTAKDAFAKLDPILTEQLNAYVAQLAPALRQAGFDPDKFADTSPPPMLHKDREQNYVGTFSIVKARKLELNTTLWKGVLQFRASADSSHDKIERQFLLGSLHSSLGLTLDTYGDGRDCQAIATLLMASIVKPSWNNKWTEAYQGFIGNAGLKRDITTRLRQTCDDQAERGDPLARIGLGTSIHTSRFDKGPVVNGSRIRWSADVYNSQIHRVRTGTR